MASTRCARSAAFRCPGRYCRRASSTRFRVVVFPVITGTTGHDRIYDGYPDVALDLTSSRTFDDSLQLLEYVPEVLTGPPGAEPAS